MDFFQILSSGASLRKKKKRRPPLLHPTDTPGVPEVRLKKKRKKKAWSRSMNHPRGDSLGSESDLRLSLALSPAKSSAADVITKTFSASNITTKTTTMNTTTNPSMQQQHDEVAAFRRRLLIHIHSSSNCPKPIPTFDLLRPPSPSPLTSTVLSNVESSNWVNPTPCQMQAIPSLLSLRDTLLCAPTGSGKTAAFMIPALLLSSLSKNKQPNVRSVVLEPTRELCEQVKRVALSLGRGGGVKVLVLR